MKVGNLLWYKKYYMKDDQIVLVDYSLLFLFFILIILIV